MKQKHLSRTIFCFLLVMLLAAAALCLSGCSGKQEATQSTDFTQLGEGSVQFTFSVTDTEGKRTDFSIRTDKATVGEALLEQKLISGDEGEYGLYVKSVNGMALDYDTDGKYWAFYADGVYASAAVDRTPVTDGGSYAFKAE